MLTENEARGYKFEAFSSSRRYEGAAWDYSGGKKSYPLSSQRQSWLTGWASEQDLAAEETLNENWKSRSRTKTADSSLLWGKLLSWLKPGEAATNPLSLRMYRISCYSAIHLAWLSEREYVALSSRRLRCPSSVQAICSYRFRWELKILQFRLCTD